MSTKNRKSTSQSQPVVSESQRLLVDIPAAARLLSTTVWAIRELLWSKQVRFVRIGRKHLIDPADLRAFIEKQKTVTA